MKSHLFVTLIVAILHGTAFGADGQCFSSIEAFMVNSFGEHYLNDENLFLIDKKYGKQKFKVSEDRTSGTNYSRSLLIERKDKGVCLLLSTPPIAQLNAFSFNRRGFPVQFISNDQAPPGLPEHEITYLFDPVNFKYVPITCKEVMNNGKKRTKKEVTCKKMLYE